jgi:hypothetical protein
MNLALLNIDYDVQLCIGEKVKQIRQEVFYKKNFTKVMGELNHITTEDPNNWGSIRNAYEDDFGGKDSCSFEELWACLLGRYTTWCWWEEHHDVVSRGEGYWHGDDVTEYGKLWLWRTQNWDVV